MRLLVFVAAVVAVAGCSSSSSGGIDVSKAKVTSTATVPLSGPGLLSPDGNKVLDQHFPFCVIRVDGRNKVSLPKDANVTPDAQHACDRPTASTSRSPTTCSVCFASPI